MKVVEKIRFGIKTGNNDFFLVKDVTGTKAGQMKTAVNSKEYIDTIIELKRQKLRLVENGEKELWLIEKCFLETILTSPKDVGKYSVNATDMHYYLFNVQVDRNKLMNNYPFAYEYIRYAEMKNLHLVPTLANRKVWYDLGEKE